MIMEWFNEWASSQDLKPINGVWRNPDFEISSFVDEYLEVREKEYRVYADQELKTLPTIKSSHPLIDEWRIREKSLKQLIQWLASTNNKQTILEIGCGNGWFSANISKNSNYEIISQDINLPELIQAARVFGNSNPKWICHDIESCNFPNTNFDQIIFASSIQYFENPKKIIDLLTPSLKTKGCIHIIDSPVYDDVIESQKANVRTTSYYEKLGNPLLAKNYHHHLITDFIEMGFEIKRKPKNNIITKFFGKSKPFYWLQLLK